MMKDNFKSIALDDYVERHVRSNPMENRADVKRQLESALQDFREGKKCHCGRPIWVIGSAFAGNACFTCITGERNADSDFEIDEACKKD